MQIRVSRVTRGERRYEYAQLVESFRREDGSPSHRVIAHLGALSASEIANLKVAIAANREGKRVVLARPARLATGLPKVAANLRYLDIAVLLELWRLWGLPEILQEVMPPGEADVSSAAVVAALAIQRCVDPGSKLYSTQWFPRSALPELLGVPSAKFNNTRVHRVLDELDAATPALMAKLPRRYLGESDGAFAALFLDVTDTWFVGGGPEIAELGKTKEGFIKRKVGIVLLCSEDGYPLRWEVVSGAAHDSKTMTEMVEAISGLAWVGEAPIVCDRAMGKTAQLRTLATSKLRFLTALTLPEFGAYAELPEIGPSADADAAVRAILAAGMEKVQDNLYVKDLGTVERTEEGRAGPEAAPASSPQRAMQVARQARELVASRQHASYAAVGRTLGVSKQLVSKYLGLCKLDESIQRALLDGGAQGCSIAELVALARHSPDEQRVAFARMKDSPVVPRRQPSRSPQTAGAASFSVRVLGYFNPERFVEQRAKAQRHLEKVRSFVDSLNAALAGPRSRRTRDSVAAAVDSCLREYDLLGAYSVTIDEYEAAGRTRLAVRVQLDEVEWARRRRYDGFTLLVAHPALTASAVELCRLYRAKDTVEKDFQVIKSVVELRPVHHRTDAKVRAHVTLCMLALLLERTLRRKLNGSCSAEAALEVLASCHLNRFSGEHPIYGMTVPTKEQRDILRALHMDRLVGDDVVEGLLPH